MHSKSAGNHVRRFGAAALLSLSPLLAGCPNPNTYGTPRTVPAGELAHTVALEGVAVAGTSSGGAVLPTLPTYQLRIGAADSVDIGVRLPNLSGIGADVKWNPIRGPVDLAIDPGAQFHYISAGGASLFGMYGHIPLLVGFNPTDWFSIVGSPGATIVYMSGTPSADSDTNISASGAAVLLRGGLGFDFRVSDGFAIHPEATALFNPDTDGMFLSFGVGLNFGKLPQFD